ncbi:branched-chain-amino-acid transaminase [Candidatus Bathyarchaeota archaeon]|nr:MAG: branched-chain-amino-acid transaminase [Candidatus Bathyarchaeota archaeon]RLG95861.1 MAG: branched-chain amino acid aminotransferase [Candidatus Bathyarchaeota archaeon]HDJ04512.1 branched-chain-amino-acid transaminase [Candidatus Bathyarchaeota archaeon]
MSGDELLIYIDGKYYPKSEAKISVYDHGFLYGDGVFEGIRSYGGVVFKLREHIDRLYASARAIMLEIPLTKEEMIEAVLETLRKNRLKDAYIRLVVTRGIGDLGLDPRKCPNPSVIIIAEPAIQLYDRERLEKGISMVISWVRRDPVDATTHEIKSLNYLNSILSKIEANNAGADEALMLDHRGFVCEATGENIFLVKGNTLITPPSSSGALPGITANVIKRIAKEMGLAVIEKDVTPTDLYNADEAFLTGTAAEIMPIREVNKRTIGAGRIGPITRKILERFNEIVRDPKEGVPIY